jgi:hypothetical protein
MDTRKRKKITGDENGPFEKYMSKLKMRIGKHKKADKESR